MKQFIRTTSSWALAFLAFTIFPLALRAQAPAPAPAAGPPKPPPPMPAPTNFNEDFEEGYLVFDDGVGVLHVRQSGSTAETDYAPGIASSKGGDDYARLLVQPKLGGGGGINGDQGPVACRPGAPEADNGVSCDGPFTEWGLPYGGFDGNFDTGIPIKGNGSMTSIDIYLDTAFAATNNTTADGKDFRFDWDSDLLDSNGAFLQDYIFNVATGNAGDTCSPGGGFFVVEASTNSQRGSANAHNPAPPNPPQVCISSSGWYTFTHVFTKDHSNNLEVDMTITTVQGNHLVASWTLHPTCMGTQVTEGLCTASAPFPFSAVGANFLGWFPDQEINDLAIDNVVRHDH